MYEWMSEKYSDNRESLSMKGLASGCALIQCFLQFRFQYVSSFLPWMLSFKRVPRNFVWDALFISWLLILSFGGWSGKLFTLLGL